MNIPFRCGYCCLAGRPNAGKSTLLNSICGEKLAIVTPKPQTTRDRIIGIKTDVATQTIYLDTPGLHRSEKALNARMMKEATDATNEADVIVFVSDAYELTSPKRGAQRQEEEMKWLKELSALGKPVITALNKADLMQKEALLPLIAAFTEAGAKVVIPVSARTGDGVAELEKLVANHLPEGPPLYPADTLTEHTERFLVAEVIREKLFMFTAEEIPYSTAVAIDDFKDKSEGLSVVYAVIYVEKDSQKAIVVGKGGAMIKKIGQSARLEMERRFGRKFFLDLKVKTKKDWTRDPNFVKSLGEPLR